MRGCCPGQHHPRPLLPVQLLLRVQRLPRAGRGPGRHLLLQLRPLCEGQACERCLTVVRIGYYATLWCTVGDEGGHNWSQHLYIFLPFHFHPATNHTLHKSDLDFWFHLTPFWCRSHFWRSYNFFLTKIFFLWYVKASPTVHWLPLSSSNIAHGSGPGWLPPTQRLARTGRVRQLPRLWLQVYLHI